MCMFTREVKDVADTRMFARLESGGRQILVYQMTLLASEPLAMVLPLPVVKGAGEDATRFINLEGCPDFFGVVGDAVPVWVDERPRRIERGDMATLSSENRGQGTLAVHAVGRYEASYVPAMGDFGRLDPRFRLPSGLLEGLGLYEDWGFAVFKLRGEAGAGRETVHPMALSFPTRHRFSMFFPTVHVHDGVVSSTARFDHLLYFQNHEGSKGGSLWYRDGERIAEVEVPQWPREAQYTRSVYRVADAFGKILPGEARYGRLRWGRSAPYGLAQGRVERSAGVLEHKLPLNGFGLSGMLRNRDTWFHVDAI